MWIWIVKRTIIITTTTTTEQAKDLVTVLYPLQALSYLINTETLEFGIAESILLRRKLRHKSKYLFKVTQLECDKVRTLTVFSTPDTCSLDYTRCKKESKLYYVTSEKLFLCADF